MNLMQEGRRGGEPRSGLEIKFPVFTGRLVLSGRHATCYLQDREIQVEAPGKLLARLVRLCDGRTPMSEIVAELGQAWSRDDLASLIDGLVGSGVLCEAGRLAEHWWTFIKNGTASLGPLAPDVALPSPTLGAVARQVHAGGGLGDLLRRRSSTRVFGSATIPFSILLSIYWASYGVSGRRTVPSAGGFYPLQIHWINLRATDGLRAGVYRLSFPSADQVCIDPVEADLAQTLRSFVDCDLLFEAQGVIVVSGNLGRTATKYGPRAGLYVPLEAGHVAQNILLAATEGGIAAVEIGGFHERQLSALLKLSDDFVPLTSVILGSAPSAAELASTKGAPCIEYRWLETDQLPYSPPFFVCAARLENRDDDWSWGRAVDPAMAHVKASAEAQERWSCYQLSGLREACIDELEHAIDPRTIIAYSSQQYARPNFPYRPFQPNCTYFWKEGVDVRSDKRHAVLADCVYFGDALDCQHPYTDANSSGVAAYPTEQGAMERAALEIIERDAFMRAWLSRSARPTIELCSLPQAISKRTRELHKTGVSVVFKDFSLGLAPVIFAFAQSSEAGFTIATACAAFDAETALDSAFMELEQAVAMRLASPDTRGIEPADVRTPADHMDLYSQRRYYRRADFLASEGRMATLSEVESSAAADWDGLCDRLDKRGQSVIWFNLTPPGAGLHGGRSPLIVGRVIVPGLVPITFGHGLEPLASFDTQTPARRHRRSSSGSPEVPCMFPHPFG
ncbi:YcaO-like family protein [uncultured Reyranella sp.]|jgi:thiazole/oxazole-forming peptide maturase SagD family component|uniref:YcaO-like family protein n=1 Tax=uncultured Reyranella sp. TaxID=735512 RepID=UPI00259C8DAC|nr:YcaO-like family protein [uncultured Reyranella sp.]